MALLHFDISNVSKHLLCDCIPMIWMSKLSKKIICDYQNNIIGFKHGIS